MDTRLYDTILPKHKIFEDIKDSLHENSTTKLYNLIEFKDDVLYVWNSIENCLFCVNAKHLEEHPDETPYQRLHLLTPPAFAVERLVSSRCGSRLCLFGARGATIAELPSRWGRGGLFECGNQTVLCKSYSLDERFLYSQGEVRRVHWHPSSLSHVLVLLSDNTIRLYNIALKTGPKLAKVISVGTKPCSQLAGRTILDSLGDTAVDFTPLPDSESLLILRGDGEVYMVQCTLDTKSGLQPRLTGPLPIYPPADDNYGSESCCIGVLGSADATVVVIATSSATVYHCVLLPAASEDDGEGHALYVIECVELGSTNTPPLPSSLDDIDTHSYPVHIYPCAGNTYACVHPGGVHTVTVPILQSLRQYLSSDPDEAEGLVNGLYSRSSVARHLVRTAQAPLGMVAVDANSPMVLVLCPDGALLARSLEPYDLEEQLYKEMQVKNLDLGQEDLNKLIKEKQKMSFTTIIQEILARESSQPILHLDKQTPRSPQECLELLSQATTRLRSEYISRQERAVSALSRKAQALNSLASHHAQWRADMLEETERVKAKAEVLNEKRALAEKHQDDLKYRCSAVVRAARSNSGPSAAERELLNELQRYRRSGDTMLQQLQQLKQHAQHKSSELKKWHEEYKKKDTALGKSHSDTISSILQQQCSAVVRAARSNSGPSAAERELLNELQRYRRSGDTMLQQLQQLKQHAQHKSSELKKWHEEYKKKDTALGKSHSDTISSILQQQCSAVVRAARSNSGPSAAERELLNELQRYRRSGDTMLQQLQQLKQHAQHKSSELKKWHEEYKKKDTALGKSHSDTISSILQQQCSAVVRAARSNSGPSAAERELLNELQRYRRSGDSMLQQLQQLKQHAHHKSSELKKWHEEYKKKDTALGKSHSDTISSILQQQTSQISALIEETKLLKDQLSIV